MLKTNVRHVLLAAGVAGMVASCGAEPIEGDGTDVQVTRGAVCATGQLTPATALSSAGFKRPATNATDGNTTTRWESAFSDPGWIVLDLGAVKTVNRVQIDWETANASAYRIDFSSDNVNWGPPVVDVGAMATGNHRIDDWTGFSVAARYVRMFGTRRNTQYGYSIYEMKVFGDGSSTCGDGTNLLTAGWTFNGATYTPTTVFTIGTANKNAVSFNYTGKTFSQLGRPLLTEFTQNITFPEAGTAWRLTLTISGMNNQGTQPPRFLATLGGRLSQTFQPTTTWIPGGNKLVAVGTLTTGNTLTIDFPGATIAKGAVVDLQLDNVPYFDVAANGTTATSTHKLNVTDVKLTRLQ